MLEQLTNRMLKNVLEHPNPKVCWKCVLECCKKFFKNWKKVEKMGKKQKIVERTFQNDSLKKPDKKPNKAAKN